MPDSAQTSAEELTANFLKAYVREGVKPEFELSNGIVLRTVAVPREVVRRMMSASPEPQPPMFQRDPESVPEPNPLDPDYLAALDEWNDNRILALRKALWSLGTEVVSVPEGMYRPEEDGWIDDLAGLGVVVERDGGRALRHFNWLELYAAQSRQDAGRIFSETASTYGLLEQEVLDAMSYFRRRAERGAYLDGAVEGEGGEHGDSGEPGDTGDSLGVRGTAGGEEPPPDVAGVGDATAA